MYLRNAILFCRRWLWLLLLGLAAGLLGGFIASRVMTPVYEATAKVMVTRGQQGKAADTVFMDDVQLILTYVELPTSEAVLSAASQAIGYPIKAKKVRVVQVGSSQVLEITVENSNAGRASEMANAIVGGMIAQNANLMTERYTANEESLTRRIAEVQAQMDQAQTQFDVYNAAQVQGQLDQVTAEITSIQDEINTLQDEIIPLLGSFDLKTQQEGQMKQNQVDQLLPLLAKYQQIKANLEVLKKPSDTGEPSADSKYLLLQSTLNQYRQIYLNLVNSLETLRLNASQYTPNVVPIETAAVPENPIRPVWYLNMVLAGFVGLVLGIGAGLLVDYSRGTLNTPEQAAAAVSAPVLGAIPELGRKDVSVGPVVLHDPNTPHAEAIRSLAANLAFHQKGNPWKILLVSAVGRGDGATFTAVNLASAFALAGKSVVLLEAGEGGGEAQRYFAHQQKGGLRDLMRIPTAIAKFGFVSEMIPSLTVIPSGVSAGEPLFLPEDRLTGLLAQLVKRAELVIIDASPLQEVNTRLLASKCDAVLVAIRPHHTSAGDLQAGLRQLSIAGAKILGFVYSRVEKPEANYFQ